MSSSRRESRSSLGNKQHDALFEFETFKKKFLLANKHITKLNSTLSVRIEELNAQISMLYVENLRLRASEIALASQLKREREQSRKILADAEAASQSLTKHLSYLRESLHIKGDGAAPPTPPSPKARRPAVIVDPGSPQFRIARPPNVPGIYEDEEPSDSSAGEQEKSVTLARKKLKTSRLSASKLPIPSRGSSPTPPSTEKPNKHRIDLSNVDVVIKPRKSIRRQSGLLKESLAPLRSGSPAFGSPIRLEAALAVAEEEAAVALGGIEVLIGEEDDPAGVSTKDKKKGKSREPRDSESEKEVSREKRKLREVEESEKSLKPKSSRNALQPIDSNVEEPNDADTKSTTQREFLRPPSPSRDSSSPVPEQPEGTSGREKRVRKSINYAEPKLNTKMRKPDPPPGTEPPRRKRSSVARTSIHKPSSPTPLDAPQDAVVGGDTASILQQTASTTLPLRGPNGIPIDPETFPIPPPRPGSAAAMYSPGPPSRTTGSTTSSQSAATAPSSSSTSSTSRPGTIDLKSRAQLFGSGNDSDGADADSEYGSGGQISCSSSNAWSNVNVDSGRRRGLPKRTAATAATAALEDIRRHSMPPWPSALSLPPTFPDFSGPLRVISPLSSVVVALLHQSSAEEPVVDEIRELMLSGQVLFSAGTIVVKVSEEVVVKLGAEVDLDEVFLLDYVSTHTGITVPMPLGAIRIGSVSYLFQSYIPGDTLFRRWPTLTTPQKISVQRQLQDILVQLRRIELPPNTAFGSLGPNPVCKDTRATTRASDQPIRSESEFDDFLLSIARRTASPMDLQSFRSLLGESHRIVLTHGDFHPRNIMVVDSDGDIRVSGIIDWEMGGFYPEYWEAHLEKTLWS